MTLTWCNSTMLSGDDNGRMIFVKTNYLCVTRKAPGVPYPYQQVSCPAPNDGSRYIFVWYGEATAKRFGARWEAAKETKP